ncbi:hypothetical protein P7C71_g1800, partial [Lecanoromycetidae sp. Uapishka_2]
MSQTELTTREANDMAAIEAEGHSGIVIKCGSDEYYVHRSIACLKSAWFQSALDGGFKEGATGIVDLSEEDDKCVARMITFFYQGEYSDDDMIPDHNDSSASTTVLADSIVGDDLASEQPRRQYPIHRSSGTETCSKMMANTAIYALADYLWMPDLKALAQHKFQDLAKTYGPDYPYHGLSELIHEVFSTTPDSDMGLRQPLIDRCAHCYTGIMTVPECVEAIKSYGELSTGMIRLVGERHVKRMNEAAMNELDLTERLYRAEWRLKIMEMEKEVASVNIDNAYQRLDNFLETKLKVTDGNHWKKWLAGDIRTTQKYLEKHRGNGKWPSQPRNVDLDKKR